MNFTSSVSVHTGAQFLIIKQISLDTHDLFSILNETIESPVNEGAVTANITQKINSSQVIEKFLQVRLHLFACKVAAKAIFPSLNPKMCFLLDR